MNETRLSSLRREPPPEFAARLRATLSEVPARAAERRRAWPLARIAASVAVVGVTAALLAVPSVRASAAALLARFRVVNFVAVDVAPERAAQLQSQALDLPDLIGGQLQVLQDPGSPIEAGSPEQAGAAAGIRTRVPGWLPPAVSLRAASSTGAGRLQVIADTTKIEHVLDLLGIDDLEVPPGLHGKVTTIAVAPVVRLIYANDTGARVEFLQARSPEVVLPDGVDITALAEIGLRVLGFEAADAKRFATSIDWRSTMLVPVPAGDVRFRHVEINGNPGLLIERSVTVENSGDQPGVTGTLTGEGRAARTTREERMLMWSADGMVFGITGNFSDESVMQMAYSVR
jgi:hypothetical protein